MTDSKDELFMIASRKKLRFTSDRGDLVVEQLWDMPLTAKNGFSLNSLAIAVNKELKSYEEESFVETSTNPRRNDLAIMLEILKIVIAIKQKEDKDRKEAASRAAMRQQIREAIEAKRQEGLSSLSLEDLEARLAELS